MASPQRTPRCSSVARAVRRGDQRLASTVGRGPYLGDVEALDRVVGIVAACDAAVEDVQAVTRNGWTAIATVSSHDRASAKSSTTSSRAAQSTGCGWIAAPPTLTTPSARSASPMTSPRGLEPGVFPLWRTAVFASVSNGVVHLSRRPVVVARRPDFAGVSAPLRRA